MQMQCKTTIRAPVERVFDSAIDLRNAPGRIKGIKKLEVLDDGPIRVGTRFRETRVMFGREATEEMKVTALERPQMYAVGCESHGCRYHSEFHFRPIAEGTEVAMTFRGEPQTLFAKIIGFLMAPMAKSIMKICAQDLEDLKKSLEANG
jgi:uncharacterized membrane protein